MLIYEVSSELYSNFENLNIIQKIQHDLSTLFQWWLNKKKMLNIGWISNNKLILWQPCFFIFLFSFPNVYIYIYIIYLDGSVSYSFLQIFSLVINDT